MVKGALMKKAVRDMKKSKAQFISIFIMAAVAVSIVTGLDCVWQTIRTHSDAMYSATNLSDLWVNISNPSETQLWGISRVSGVESVEKRFTVNADTDLDGDPSLKVYALPDGGTLDRPEIQRGSFTGEGGAVLDSAFAKAHRLKIGDHISVQINDQWIRLPIEGLALSSEQIYSVNGTTVMRPDPSQYGFLVIHANILEQAYGQDVYNQISVKLSPGADVGQVEKQIDSVIGDDLTGLTAKDDSSSVNSVSSKIQQFQTFSIVFPFMFFIVTALITQSTMSRLVENQRNQIGILKALGYGKRSILWHYTSYGIYVGVLASIAGLLLGPRVFGGMIAGMKLNLDNYRIVINWKDFLLSSLLILLCTGGVSFLSCLRMQGNSPAVLLRDKPPKKGSRIFLERFPELWQKMKFSSKLIARNTLKNKLTLIMSVIGIMGCTGLIISALTIRDMVGDVAQQMYGDTYSYDQKIILDKNTDSRYIHNLMLDGVTQQEDDQSLEVVGPDGTRKMEPFTIYPGESPLIHLHDVDGNAVQLPQNGVAITRKLAELLGVKVGDILQIRLTDGKYAAVPVRQTYYMTAGQGIQMTDRYWESLGEEFEPTSLLVKWNRQPDQKFLSSDTVDSYRNRTDQKADIESTLQSLTRTIMILILMGAILAFVVLYNSSILNFSERIRDLATLKVLGFRQKEIRSLVLAENIISVLLGVLFGIPVGKIISDFVAGGLDENMDLITHITAGNVAIAGALTFLFAFVVNKIVAEKMKHIDMLSALKSVE